MKKMFAMATLLLMSSFLTSSIIVDKAALLKPGSLAVQKSTKRATQVNATKAAAARQKTTTATATAHTGSVQEAPLMIASGTTSSNSSRIASVPKKAGSTLLSGLPQIVAQKCISKIIFKTAEVPTNLALTVYYDFNKNGIWGRSYPLIGSQTVNSTNGGGISLAPISKKVAQVLSGLPLSVWTKGIYMVPFFVNAEVSIRKTSSKNSSQKVEVSALTKTLPDYQGSDNRYLVGVAVYDSSWNLLAEDIVSGLQNSTVNGVAINNHEMGNATPFVPNANVCYPPAHIDVQVYTKDNATSKHSGSDTFPLALSTTASAPAIYKEYAGYGSVFFLQVASALPSGTAGMTPYYITGGSNKVLFQ